MNAEMEPIARKPNGVTLMTHIVAGYPDYETSVALAILMAQSGADLLEIQIPFSDPIADGPVIQAANDGALKNDMTVERSFALVHEIHSRVRIPLFLMTYCNIPFRMGFDGFIRRSKHAGIRGIIIPDLPFDEDDAQDYYTATECHGVWPIQVVSPGCTDDRLSRIVDRCKGFMYLTLRIGITGPRECIDTAALRYLEGIRLRSPLPIACGFGISTPKQVRGLRGRADIVVVGSALITVFEQGGFPAVTAFVEECTEI